MTTTPRIILPPDAAQECRARFAPRFGQRPRAVTLGSLPGFPMGRYYVHPDGTLTRPGDELRATIDGMRRAFEQMGDVFGSVRDSLIKSLGATQADFSLDA